MDNIDRSTRSKVMASIRSRENRSTERRLRAYLIRYGISGWCVRPRGITGTHDFAFHRARIALFVDGCFWHGCPLCGRLRASASDYWHRKITVNKKRDQLVSTTLSACGWQVLRIWEHELQVQRVVDIIGKISDLIDLVEAKS
jgi:DNA mismatch endonuclease, patch repair protein